MSQDIPFDEAMSWEPPPPLEGGGCLIAKSGNNETLHVKPILKVRFWLKFYDFSTLLVGYA